MELFIIQAVSFICGLSIYWAMHVLCVELPEQMEEATNRINIEAKIEEMREKDRKDNVWKLQKQMAYITVLATKGWPTIQRALGGDIE